jgi:hypothetical protein
MKPQDLVIFCYGCRSFFKLSDEEIESIATDAGFNISKYKKENLILTVDNCLTCHIGEDKQHYRFCKRS